MRTLILVFCLALAAMADNLTMPCTVERNGQAPVKVDSKSKLGTEVWQFLTPKGSGQLTLRSGKVWRTFKLDQGKVQVSSSDGQKAAMSIDDATLYMMGELKKIPGADLATCKINERNLGTGLEMYGMDHKGQYPARLSEIVPAYIREIPKCGGKDTYSTTYRVSKGGFELGCQSDHKAEGCPAGFPKYTSEKGLILK